MRFLVLICFVVSFVLSWVSVQKLDIELSRKGGSTGIGTGGPSPDVVCSYFRFKREHGEALGLVFFFSLGAMAMTLASGLILFLMTGSEA